MTTRERRTEYYRLDSEAKMRQVKLKEKSLGISFDEQEFDNLNKKSTEMEVNYS